MTDRLIYIPDFYTRADADELFDFIRDQPSVRPENRMFGGGRSFIRRLSFPGYAPSPDVYRTDAQRENCGGTAIDAPPLYRKFAAALTAHAGKLANYMSTIGFLVDDHMHAHQHAEDRRLGPGNQTVWVLCLGAMHPIEVTSGSTQAVANKKTGHITQKFVPDGGSETFFPIHGSLYILPSSFNEVGSGNEHEHAVLPGEDYSYGGLRVGINCKHIPAGLQEDEFNTACSRSAGRTNAHDGTLDVREIGGPRIYDCHKGKKYPADAVYVGREVRSRQTARSSGRPRRTATTRSCTARNGLRRRTG
jgi:hypothetical protein